MKKRLLLFSFSIIVGLSLILLINHFSESKNDISTAEGLQKNEFPVIMSSVEYFLIEDINTLEERSTLIIQGSFTGNRSQKNWKESSTSEVIARGSKSEIKVGKIYKGAIENNSSTISIYEPAYFENSTFVSIAGYNLLIEKEDYLLFLRPANNDDTYVIVGMYQGKYNLSSSDAVKSVQSFKTYADVRDTEYFGENMEDYNKLKSQVLEKYLQK
ncbi:hypothetical protein NYE67_16145 [Solibacillus sp. FSL W8-0474]|uniref:hypothetical protein n=1 Tax=Solibacillus sp. FSL W8-0474 TaxID=2975336 RepID=UPI0030F80FF2